MSRRWKQVAILEALVIVVLVAFMLFTSSASRSLPTFIEVSPAAAPADRHVTTLVPVRVTSPGGRSITRDEFRTANPDAVWTVNIVLEAGASITRFDCLPWKP